MFSILVTNVTQQITITVVDAVAVIQKLLAEMTGTQPIQRIAKAILKKLLSLMMLLTTMIQLT